MTVQDHPNTLQGPILNDTTAEYHSEDGVDLTLIRWMLSLTPTERLEVLRRYIHSVERLRNAKASS